MITNYYLKPIMTTTKTKCNMEQNS